MRLIETSNLEYWAGLKIAESRFPYHVRALICAVIHPEKLRMPSGDAVWLPGFDAELVNNEKSRFVPMGVSVWEVGTDKDYKGKANRDFNKRSTDKGKGGKKKNTGLQLNRAETIFVFVTPRVWKDKADWVVAERKTKPIWQDIMVIDGVDLVDWLEYAPAVSLQWASELPIVPEDGLQASEQAWEYWSRLTEPPTSEELVVAGREEQERELVSRLVGPPCAFTVRGDSPREAWGFALAAMRRVQSEEDRVKLDARIIVADNEQVANRLQHLENNIIVLKQAPGQVSGILSSRGCHVIIPEGNESHSERNVIRLTRPTHRQFAEALGNMGLAQDEAERATRACGLSITILQRQKAHANYERPRWCNDKNVVHLLPAVLAGRWNDRNESDKKILCQLAGTDDYANVENNLMGFLLVDEPPLQRVGEMWTLTAPADAFQLTARRLTASILSRFKVAFREVFGKIDPKVETPPDQRIYVDIRGEQGNSDWLRSGMAEALLLIAERGKDAQLACVQSPSTYADDVVRGLPGLNDNWRLLASLRDQYSRLMEAVPNPFLDSLERMLEAKPDDVRRLFIEGEGIFGASAMHTGLLWGLETMAWSPDYLPRVALILSRLASLDPGGRLVNRPINSLREIFLWWHLGTNASLDQRLAAIDLILDREPDIGWMLLVNLLPIAPQSFSHGTAKPRWRDFGDLPKDTHNKPGQIRYVSAIIDRVLDRVGSDSGRWKPLLDSLAVMNHSQLDIALSQLNAIAEDPFSADIKAALWQTLREFIYQNRTYQGASWVLANEQIDRLEAILPRLAPSDPIERYRWLFDEWLPDLPTREEDFDLRQEQVKELRQKAIGEILRQQGVEGLVRLGTTCKLPGFVASIAVPLIYNLDVVRIFIERAISVGETGIFLAGQVSGQAHQLHGQLWRDQVWKDARAETWSPVVIASLLLWWPNVRATWEIAAALGVETEYWRRKPVFAIDGSPEEKSYQIGHLITVGRAAEAFDRIALQGEDVPTEILVQLFEATLNELVQAQTPEEVRRLGINSFDMGRFLAELRRRRDLPREELARMEYQALPLIGTSDARGLTLHEFMADDPNFFVDVLCDAFLPAHRDKSKYTEPTPEVQFRAKAAFSLLRGMERIPGQREENLIDEETILKWAHAVRKKAVEVDRAVIADQHIGQILAHSPQDPEDGGWPHKVVRNVIEKLAADEIDRGLMIERHNMRGIYSKAPYEGGAQERALADQYRDWADISRARWPRMARVLDMMAQSWEEHARREDVEAEQDKLD